MYKMAVVGDYDSIYGFAALGLDTFPADGPEKLEQVFHSLVSGGYAVIYMTEAAAAQSAAQWSGTEKACFRAVILIPGVSGNTGKGIEGVKKSVEQAVGSDILFGGV